MGPKLPSRALTGREAGAEAAFDASPGRAGRARGLGEAAGAVGLDERVWGRPDPTRGRGAGFPGLRSGRPRRCRGRREGAGRATTEPSAPLPARPLAQGGREARPGAAYGPDTRAPGGPRPARPGSGAPRRHVARPGGGRDGPQAAEGLDPTPASRLPAPPAALAPGAGLRPAHARTLGRAPRRPRPSPGVSGSRKATKPRRQREGEGRRGPGAWGLAWRWGGWVDAKRAGKGPGVARGLQARPSLAGPLPCPLPGLPAPSQRSSFLLPSGPLGSGAGLSPGD